MDGTHLKIYNLVSLRVQLQNYEPIELARYYICAVQIDRRVQHIHVIRFVYRISMCIRFVCVSEIKKCHNEKQPAKVFKFPL